jgi:hypothetical protein
VGRDGAAYGFDLGKTRRELFLQTRLDDPNHVDPEREIFFYAHDLCARLVSAGRQPIRPNVLIPASLDREVGTLRQRDN